MKKLVFILFIQFVVAQQVPIDSISYDYFYEKELKQIVRLKEIQENKPFNSKKQFEIAEQYQNINCEDSAYATYFKIYEYEKVQETFDNHMFNELLFKLHKIESSKTSYDKERRYFLGELQTLTQNDASDEWSAKIKYERFKDYFLDSAKYNLASRDIKAVQKSEFYKSNEQFKTSVLIGLGYFQTIQKQYLNAEATLFDASYLAEKNKDTLNEVYSFINLSVNENYRKNYEKALYYVDKASKVKNTKFRIKLERIFAIIKGNSYYGLKDSVNLKQQDLRLEKLNLLIDDFRKNSNFYEIDIAYQVKEKDKKILELSSFKNTFKKNRIVYSILLFMVFLLALYSFVRWKKSDRNKKRLDEENEFLNIQNKKTKSELENVKSLVHNDHIILKNKTKVYLSELIYIKSDGHYLNLNTTAKKEFVRGKISEMEQQLPPNFVKCQRSYIVNQNYIKQYTSTEVFMSNGDVVPLSRGFKFEN